VHIDWQILATVAIVAAAAALVVVMLVAFALVALSAHPRRQVDRPSAGGPDVPAPASQLIAGLCLLAAGSIVCCGLYLIVA
jgi:hypothetical protein